MRTWLVNKRKEYGMKQLDVAGQAGISRAHYAKIEKGVRRPSYEVAIKIAAILNFDWRLFFENS